MSFDIFEDEVKKPSWAQRHFNKDIKRLEGLKSQLAQLKERTIYMQQVFDLEKQKFLERIKQEELEARIREKKFNVEDEEPIKRKYTKKEI